MKKFEYKKLVTRTDADWVEVEKLGEKGWEMISTRYDSGNVIYIFKR